MQKKEDKNTRYYVDVDLKSRLLIDWGFDQRHEMEVKLANAGHHRVFLTKGQFYKLEKKLAEY